MAIIRLLCLLSATGVHAFTSSSTPRFDCHACFVSSLIKRNNIPSSLSPSATRAAAADAGERLALFARNNPDDDGKNQDHNKDKDENNPAAGTVDWIRSRLERADVFEIRRDVILISCFVLGRYFLYDVTTGQKLVAGFDINDIIWLTGTVSSAALLGLYWTAAGLLTRLFETRGATSLPANAVNIAMCCPLWIATEHLLQFGPPDIGGPTLDASVANGFVGLASFMAVMKTVTLDWR